jgi:N12 class adenine-specific DNA methylase
MREYLAGRSRPPALRSPGLATAKGLSVKKLERRIAQMEENYKRLLAEHTKDDGVRFEETGIDFLFCDEAHAYKNRRVDSSIDGAANTGSQQPRTSTPSCGRFAAHGPSGGVRHSDPGGELDGRAVGHADLPATRPARSGRLRPFDAGAATFGRTHTALELAPDGSSYRMQTRFARFQNVPELLTLYRQVADVRTLDDLDLPTPPSPADRPRRSWSTRATTSSTTCSTSRREPNASATGPSTPPRTTC